MKIVVAVCFYLFYVISSRITIVERKEVADKVLNDNEERIIAKGLRMPGPLLVVKKKLETVQSRHLRVIVSSNNVAEELVKFFEDHHAVAEIDRAGDDFHVVADITNLRGVE